MRHVSFSLISTELSSTLLFAIIDGNMEWHSFFFFFLSKVKHKAICTVHFVLKIDQLNIMNSCDLNYADRSLTL